MVLHDKVTSIILFWFYWVFTASWYLWFSLLDFMTCFHLSSQFSPLSCSRSRKNILSKNFLLCFFLFLGAWPVTSLQCQCLLPWLFSWLIYSEEWSTHTFRSRITVQVPLPCSFFRTPNPFLFTPFNSFSFHSSTPHSISFHCSLFLFYLSPYY